MSSLKLYVSYRTGRRRYQSSNEKKREVFTRASEQAVPRGGWKPRPPSGEGAGTLEAASTCSVSDTGGWAALPVDASLGGSRHHLGEKQY